MQQKAQQNVYEYAVRALLVLCLFAALFTAHVEAADDELRIAESGNVYTHSLPPTNLHVDEEGRYWTLPKENYFWGLGIGLVLAVYSVYTMGRSASAAHASVSGRHSSFDRFGHARALLSNPYVWAYIFLTIAFAGLIYSGFFRLARDQIADSIPLLASWGPVGGSVLATFAWTELSRHFSWVQAASDGNLGEILHDMEEESAASGKEHWLSTLAWSSLEDDRQEKMTDLANLYSVGFIRHAVQSHCRSAINKGRLATADVEKLLDMLADVPAGEDDRQRFINRRHAVQIAARIVPLENLEQIIQENDRRKGDRRVQHGQTPRDRERRTQADRRVDGALTAVAA